MNKKLIFFAGTLIFSPILGWTNPSLRFQEDGFYALELRMENQRKERNYSTYGRESLSTTSDDFTRLDHVHGRQERQSRGSSFYASQIHAQGNFINRMNGYFAPQGVNIHDHYALKSQLIKDQARRNFGLAQLTGSLQEKIATILEEENKITRELVTPNGEIATYDRSTILNKAEKLKQLGDKTQNLESYIGREFKNHLRNKMIPPYLEKADQFFLSKQADQAVHFYLKGANLNFLGISNLKSSLYNSAVQFGEIAREIGKKEDQMQDQFVQNYVLGSFVLATTILTAIPTGGAALPMAAKVALGASITGQTVSLGETLRSHIVLNQKGLEGFHSEGEAKSKLGLGAFQYLTQTISGVAQIYQTGKDFSSLWGEMNNPQKFYSFQQVLSHLNHLTEIGGIKEKVLGENSNHLLNLTMQGADFGWGFSSVPATLQIMKQAKAHGFTRSQEIKDFVEEQKLQPIHFQDQKFSQLLDRFGDSIAFFSSFPKGKEFLNENLALGALNEAGNFYRALEPKLFFAKEKRIYKLAMENKIGSEELLKEVSLNKITPTIIRKYVEKEGNLFFLQEAKMKEEYHSRLPVLLIHGKNQITFLRPENFSESQLSSQKVIARAELYKRYPLLDIPRNEENKNFFSINNKEGFISEYGTIPQYYYLEIKKAQEQGKNIHLSEIPYTKKEIILKTPELLLTFSNRDGEWFVESSNAIDLKRLNQLMLKYKIDLNLKN